MRSDQIRRLENLEKEKAGPTRLQARLRQWASRLGVPEKAFLRAAECYAHPLRGELGGRTVTWPTFQLLHDIALSVTEPVRPSKAA
jgi:hypothetical protein